MKLFKSPRARNAEKYPFVRDTSAMPSADKSTYETNEWITAIAEGPVNGFHFRPERKTHAGVVVTYGGSEGSPNYERARQLAEHGYETLAVFLFGQPGLPPTMADVPLEGFEGVRGFVDKQCGGGPVTVIGTSKGAEFALLLAARAFAVDNVVAFAPGHYSYAGLDFTGRYEKPSFTFKGGAVPFASLRRVPVTTAAPMFWKLATGAPVSHRASYEGAAANAPEDARIDLSTFAGKVLLFAGEEDRMWQADTSARELAKQGEHVEAHVYPGAGHVFFNDAESLTDGWQIMLGGTAEGNRAAAEDSDRILMERLAQWHPAVEVPPAPSVPPA